jgi:hypothetical protein
VGREWAYKNIKPRIICEKLLTENGASPKDYKIFCFNGEPKVIQVDLERFKDHKRNMYDINWNLLPVNYMYETEKNVLEKPLALAQMLGYAKQLSADLPFVRVDFYNVDGKIIFGEMTFYPENAIGQFQPESYDHIFGSYLQLPN